MGKVCVNHKDAPAMTMCHRCHKPVCTPCTLVTPQGSFCSPECAVMFREFKDKLKEEKERPTGFFTKAAAVFVLTVVGFMGVHAAATHGATPLQRVDVIGLILRLVQSPREGAPR